MCNLFWATHSKAELNNLNLRHELEQPMSMHLSSNIDHAIAYPVNYTQQN